MAHIFNKTIRRFFWVPFVIGLIGYFAMEHLPLWESVYASAALYFVNPVVENRNALILLAEILAIIVTTGILIGLLSSLFRAVDQFFIRRYRDAAAFYGDDPAGKQLAERFRHGYTADGKRVEKTGSHIIMYREDADSIGFFTAHEKELKGKQVYMLLHETDPSLLKANETVRFFNLYDLMARRYWKEQDLYDEMKADPVLRIAIVGFGKAGEAIFRYGYLNNLYRTDQRIEYHLWGPDPVKRDFYEKLPFANGDTVLIHDAMPDALEPEDIRLLSGMSRVILTQESFMPLLQELLYQSSDAQIHCYSEKPMALDEFFSRPGLLTFGASDEILTEDAVRRETLYRQAKLFNYDYQLRYESRNAPADFEKEMEQAWISLDGFKKGSNVARADHYWIENRLAADGAADETLWRLEHIRWCRYHYLNHWKYDPVRDNIKRCHPLLVPYEELPAKEQEKDGIYDDRIRREIMSLDGKKTERDGS